MTRIAMSMMKGIGAGVAVGLAAGFMCGGAMKSNKKLRRRAGHALHSVEDMLDNVQSMFH